MNPADGEPYPCYIAGMWKDLAWVWRTMDMVSQDIFEHRSWVKVIFGMVPVNDIQQATELHIQSFWLYVVTLLPFEIQKEEDFAMCYC